MLTTATGLFPGLARLGVTQLVNGVSARRAARPGQGARYAPTLSTAGQARSQRDELAMVPTMMAQARAVTDLGDLPLYVLTAPVDTQTNWLTPQTELAALSDNSVHLVVAGASHQSLLNSSASEGSELSQISGGIAPSTEIGNERILRERAFAPGGRQDERS